MENNSFIKIINYIHNEIGERVAGSREEKLASSYLKSVFEKFSDDIKIDSFPCVPRSSQYEINFFCIMYCISLLGYIVYPIISIFSIIFVFIYLFISEFYGIKLLHLILPKSRSQNLIAKIKASKEKKQTIIFSAHIDSPYIVELFESKLKEYIFELKKVFFLFFIVLLLIVIINIFNLIPSLVDYLYLIPFVGLSFVIFFQNKVVTYERSFGANSSLAGVSVLAQLADYFYLARLKNTELVFCLFGSKEQNLTGSKDFVAKNYKDLKNIYNINLDAISGDKLIIAKKEGFVKHDKELIKIILEIGKKNNLDIKTKNIELMTDANSFSFEKIPATSILSLDKNGIPLNYCSKKDIPSNISEEQLEKIYKLCLETAKKLDER